MSCGSGICNGPLSTGMYSVKPYYDNNMPLELPQCMYTLSSIYSNEVSDKEQAQTNVTGLVSVKIPLLLCAEHLFTKKNLLSHNTE